MIACGKIGYPSQADAQLALVHLRRKFPVRSRKAKRRDYSGTHEYRCGNCGLWHITSRGVLRRRPS